MCFCSRLWRPRKSNSQCLCGFAGLKKWKSTDFAALLLQICFALASHHKTWQGTRCELNIFAQVNWGHFSKKIIRKVSFFLLLILSIITIRLFLKRRFWVRRLSMNRRKMRGLEMKIRRLRLKMRRFRLKMRGLELKTRGLEMKTCGFETKTRGLETKTCGLETKTCGLKLRISEIGLKMIGPNKSGI